MTKIFDCEIRNTVQRLEVIQKINEWFPHLLEGTEFLTKAVQETRRHLQQNIAELDAEKVKPEQTTINLDENEEFQRARDMVVAAVEVLAQTKEKIEKGVNHGSECRN